MAVRVDGMGDYSDMYETKFEVTDEWCLAINNIDYVRQSLQPFTTELNMEEMLRKLSEIITPVEADRCRQTLENVIENSIDTVRNKIIDLLDTVVQKMAPAMRRLLIEGAELHPQDTNSVDKVMRYLDQNLAILHEQLNQDNFQRTLDVVWLNLAQILNDILVTNLEKRRPPSFFYNLNETLKQMKASFSQSGSMECDDLKRIEYLLALNGQETKDLIHSVHLERYKEQKKWEGKDESEYPFGQLTVRCKFQDTTLKIEVMNARNLIAMDTNGKSKI